MPGLLVTKLVAKLIQLFSSTVAAGDLCVFVRVTGIGASPLAAPGFVRFYLLLNEARANARFRKKVCVTPNID